jgi:predicted MFS family arabinose efflux permease
VPFAKTRLAVDDGFLGLLLLCLGIGSVIAMLLTGVLSARLGSKPIIIASSLGLSLVLPTLSLAATPATLGLCLFAFGAFLGSLDVAMNVHAVEVERAAGRPLMSGFHAMFSIGGFLGATLMTFLLSLHLTALFSTVASALLMVIATAVAWPRLLKEVRPEAGQLSVKPRGVVVLLAALAGILFLVEGAVLDWGALLITRMNLVQVAHGGIGYVLFSIAMTTGRLAGDAVVARVGDRAILLWGSLVAIAGFAILLAAPIGAIAMAGFLLIGFGASNIVPVLFRAAGSQKAMPVALAVAAITTVGYAGVLLGPAAVGYVANAVGLPNAFWMLAALLTFVTFSARRIASY